MSDVSSISTCSLTSPRQAHLSEAKAASIWVIAGTTEARRMCTHLLSKGHAVIATVTTPGGAQLLRAAAPAARIEVGPLGPDEMVCLILEKDIRFVLDASHPYADIVSRNAIAAAQRTGIPYLRYERPSVIPRNHPLVTWAKDFDDAAVKAASFGSTIFLTVGSRELRPFVAEARRAQAALVARILDDPLSISLARDVGLVDDEIRFFHGRFDDEWRRGHFRELEPSVIVCKDSGIEGGTAEKLQACEELGIPLVVVERPTVEYPAVASSFTEAAERVAELL